MLKNRMLFLYHHGKMMNMVTYISQIYNLIYKLHVFYINIIYIFFVFIIKIFF